MYVCMHVCIRTCVHAYVYTYIRTYIHTCMHTCIQADSQTDGRTDGQTDRCVCGCIFHTYTCAQCFSYSESLQPNSSPRGQQRPFTALEVLSSLQQVPGAPGYWSLEEEVSSKNPSIVGFAFVHPYFLKFLSQVSGTRI